MPPPPNKKFFLISMFNNTLFAFDFVAVSVIIKMVLTKCLSRFSAPDYNLS